MKKNKFLRIASAMLMLCLITTCAVSGTFAKYTTSDSDSDTARVAKWGVTVAVGGTLFGTNYGSNTALADADKDRIVATSTNVVSSGTDNIVAPGTKNDTGFQVQLKGNPEVAFTIVAEIEENTASVDKKLETIFLKAGTYGVMVKAEGVNEATNFSTANLYTLSGGKYTKATAYSNVDFYELHDYVVVDSDYYPIKWTVKTGDADAFGSGGSPDVYETTSITLLENEILEYFNGVTGGGGPSGVPGPADSKAYNAGVTLDQMLVLTWEWAITNTVTGASEAEVNAMDTILGNLGVSGVKVVKYSETTPGDATTGYYSAPASTDYNLEVAFNLEITATQVD